MHLYFHNLLPKSFESIWPTNFNRREEEDLPNLRNDQDIVVPFGRTNFSQKMPLSFFPKIWNDLRNIFKYDPNNILFSKKLKECIFAQLNEEFVCPRANCPSCL
jgi:hypothetical protein